MFTDVEDSAWASTKNGGISIEVSKSTFSYSTENKFMKFKKVFERKQFVLFMRRF